MELFQRPGQLSIVPAMGRGTPGCLPRLAYISCASVSRNSEGWGNAERRKAQGAGRSGSLAFGVIRLRRHYAALSFVVRGETGETGIFDCGFRIVDCGLREGARYKVQGVRETFEIAAGKPLPQNSCPFTAYCSLREAP
jgi:hypothetical protein